MINIIIDNMLTLSKQLKDAILLDIEDVKLANHISLANRNETKQTLITSIGNKKQELNQSLSDEINNGKDIQVYREKFDILENDLQDLYVLNGKLASIIMPVREMYSDIVKDIRESRGGSIVDIKV